MIVIIYNKNVSTIKDIIKHAVGRSNGPHSCIIFSLTIMYVIEKDYTPRHAPSESRTSYK
jgi:hypothetical protein